MVEMENIKDKNIENNNLSREAEQEKVIKIFKEISKNMPTRWEEYSVPNHFVYDYSRQRNDDLQQIKG